MADTGRPSKYKEEFCIEAEKLCRLGATDKELADFFEISKATLNNWKTEHPEFLDSLKNGKMASDVRVTEALFKKATGFEYQEEQAFKCKAYDEKGRQIEVLQSRTVTKFIPPDSTACFFWLKNRQPAKWRDKQDINVSGDVGIEVTWQE